MFDFSQAQRKLTEKYARASIPSTKSQPNTSRLPLATPQTAKEIKQLRRARH
jgi:hypothetical protein